MFVSDLADREADATITFSGEPFGGQDSPQVWDVRVLVDWYAT
jgi:hypothetical protein